jgi:murein DD-endopeptidase MepM/ murein hydrolase activator NlpD
MVIGRGGWLTMNSFFSSFQFGSNKHITGAISFALSLLTVVMAFEAQADYYKYVSEDGVECYTDSPGSKKASLVMRDSKGKKQQNKSSVASSNNSEKVSQVPLSTARARNLKTLGLPVGGMITSTVGMRHDPIDGLLRHHKGLDIAVPEGTRVKPVAPGIIAFSGNRSGYGNMVIIEHDDGMVTIYAHHRINLVGAGERVDRGSTIALSGSTGRSTGPHLHFEAWYGNENITPEFVGGNSIKNHYATNARYLRKTDSVRKVALADGSLFFTNLPFSHP